MVICSHINALDTSRFGYLGIILLSSIKLVLLFHALFSQHQNKHDRAMVTLRLETECTFPL